jgi:protein ImuA
LTEHFDVPESRHAPALEQAVELAEVWSELRTQVRAIECGGTVGVAPVVPFGVAVLDRCLAGGGLALGRVHEVVGEARSEVRDAAAVGFTAALLVRLLRVRECGGDVLWCPRGANSFGGMLSARGLAELGLDPGRIIRVEAHDEADRLWVMEEGLRCSGLAAVVAELGPAHPGRGARNSVSCRRLQLAAEASGVTGILLRSDAGAAAAIGTPESRWQVAGHSSPEGLDWRPFWQVKLLRARNGRSGEAKIVWEAERGIFHPEIPLSTTNNSPMKVSPAPIFAVRSAA